MATADIGKLKKGDTLADYCGLTKPTILKISGDGKTVTLSGNCNSTAGTLALAADEAVGLTAQSGSAGATPVQNNNGSTNILY